MNENIIFEAPLLRGRFIVFDQKPTFEFLQVKQIHSNIVVAEENSSSLQEGDAIVGNSPTPKAILTADCLPIVLIGSDQHAVIHAGWKGLENQILTNDVFQKMKPTYAYIGPHIRVQNYEVGPDFKNHFPHDPEAFIERDQKTFFDLAAVAVKQLQKAYPSLAIVDCGLCTFINKNFHSYRRNQTSDRNWNIYFPQ